MQATEELRCDWLLTRLRRAVLHMRLSTADLVSVGVALRGGLISADDHARDLQDVLHLREVTYGLFRGDFVDARQHARRRPVWNGFAN